MRQGRDADSDADLGIGHRVIDRRHQVVHRPFEPPQERRRHALRASLHIDRLGLERQARGGLVHPRVDVEEGGALAVDGDLDLLTPGGVAEQHAEGLGEEIHAEGVVAIGRERVHDRDAAAGAERRAVDAGQLRGRLRQRVGGLAGRAVGIADRQRRHAAGGAQVALEQRRREALGVGDVVEALTDGVGRQERRDVDVHAEQVVDGAGVLGAVEALERPPAGIRVGGGMLVHACLERAHEIVERSSRRTLRPGRRHHAGAQLTHDLLDDLRRFLRPHRVEAGERQPSGLGAVAVAGGAVGGDQLALHRGAEGMPGRGRRRLTSRRRGDGRRRHGPLAGRPLARRRLPGGRRGRGRATRNRESCECQPYRRGRQGRRAPLHATASGPPAMAVGRSPARVGAARLVR